MTHEDYVNFEQAKALKELGFKEKCFTFYTCLGNLEINHLTFSGQHIKLENYNDDSINEKYKNVSFSAPSLSRVQKWLREKEIEVGAFGDFDGEFQTDKWVWLMRKFNTHLYDTVFPEDISYDTYEEALSAGIDAALELLKQHNNER